jgi:hypothetical protein
VSDASGRWQFFLANSSDLTKIGIFGDATSRQLELQYNRPGTFSTTMPIDTPLAFKLAKRRTCILAERNERVIWSGPITTIVDDAVARTTAITATGWMEELDHRYVRSSEVPSLVFTNVADSTIIATLLNTTNSATDTDGTTRPTHVVANTAATSTTQRTRSYKAGDAYGPIIRELSDIENGCDLILDPQTRILSAVSNTSFINRTNVHFSLGGDAGTNLSGATRTDDGTSLANRINVQSSTGAVISADDSAAIDDAGVMLEDWLSLSDVGDNQIVDAYANAELVYRRYGVVTYSLTPMTFGILPRLFDDFNLGDQVYFSVNAGRFVVYQQAIRVFTATISPDDSGNEVVGELGVSPAS